MTDALKDLIHDGDWLGIAKAITLAYVDAPVNPKKFAWVSAVEEGPYHIETNDSAANGGDTFKALCGVSGDFNAHKLPAQIFPSQKCGACVEISSKQVLDSALERCGESQRILEPHKDLPTEGQGRGADADSVISDLHGDDRFADNILRACENLPQNGDDLEEEAAAEEGAAIEASNLHDPAHDPRFA